MIRAHGHDTARPRDAPEAGIIQKVLGGMNRRFAGSLALLATVFVLDLFIPDFIPFVDEIILAILTMIFALWKERRSTVVTTATSGPPLPQARPPLPPAPPAGR